MVRCEFDPYEGTENYIFVSYAHKDSEAVFSVIEQLHKRGYRIWYDDGIAPGSEWPEDIANHLNGCALMMAFITPNSLASDNCRREITYALAKKKAFLGVILEPVEMSPGIEMQLSAQQCVIKYSYRNDEAFLKKLYSCQGLAGCRAEIPEDAQVPEADVPAPVVVKETPKKPVKTTVPEKTKASKPTKQKKLLMIGGIILAVLVVALSIAGRIGSRTQILDEYVSIYEENLYLSGKTITKAVAENISRLEKVKSVSFTGCDFEAGALSALTLPETVNYLSFDQCTGVDNLEFLTALKNLRRLNLTNSAITDAMLPEFTSETLDTLDLQGNPEFTDLSLFSNCTALTCLNVAGTGVSNLEVVAALPVDELDISGSGVTDISVLAEMPDLNKVDGSNTKIRDISPLAGLENLYSVSFNNCALDPLEGSFSSLRMKYLYLANTGLTSLDAFRNCTVLQEVDIHGNAVSDVSILGKSSASLTVVNLSGNPLSGASIEFLAEAEKLREIYLDGIAMENLDILVNATGLHQISAVGCGLSDISGLSGCVDLSMIKLAKNQITDISPLQNIKTLYVKMDLSFNPIRDVSALPEVNYSVLGLLCPELDPATFPDVDGNMMLLYYSQEALEHIMSLKKFTYVVVDCPADKQVALEDAVNTARLRLPKTMDQVVEILMTLEYDASYLLESGE